MGVEVLNALTGTLFLTNNNSNSVDNSGDSTPADEVIITFFLNNKIIENFKKTLKRLN